MFELTEKPIIIPALEHVEAGGFVTFEGKVRNHNEGQPVIALEYEAFAPLAIEEGNRVIAEALKRFDVIEIRAIHRTGDLKLGDTAIWIGVASAHRRASFLACEFIIDEIKKRVPIWKRETYANGKSEWVNCQNQGSKLTSEAFYSRQSRLPEVGAVGQERLTESSVLVVGAGGLGCPALLYLAGAGIGKIGLCEADIVDISNLHRQFLYGVSDVGQPKAWLAERAIRKLNPFIEVEVFDHLLTPANASNLIRNFDIVLDCTDNFKTKFLLNDVCVELRKPLVQASIHQFEGQVQVIDSSRNTGCLRCLWPEAPDEGCVGSCAESGVFGVVPGFFGAIQAAEAIKTILEIGETLTSTALLVDLRTYSTLRISRPKNPDCPACGLGQITKGFEVTIGELDDAMILVDIRDDFDEPEKLPIPGREWRRIAPDRIEKEELDPSRTYVLVCQRGIRSAQAVRRLQEAGKSNFRSLIGGAQGLVKRIGS